MNSPYAPPTVEEDSAPEWKRKKLFWKRMMIGSLAVILSAVVTGGAGTIAGMTSAFGELNRAGNADPEALAGNISMALLTTLYGVVVGVPVLILLLVSIFRFRAAASKCRETGR